MPTIATGGTAQDAFPARPSRRGYRIQNLSAASLWRRAGADATIGEPSFEIVAGAMFEPAVHEVGSGNVQARISIIGATLGQAFAVEEW